MEILNSSNKRRTVLIVSDGEYNLDHLREIVEKEFNVFFVDKPNEDYQSVHDNAGVISAAIICASDAADKNYALFDWIKQDNLVSAVPLIIYAANEFEFEEVDGCIKRGAVDVIMPPLDETVTINRIENAIRLKDSATFYEIERMLKELPSNIYLKDKNGRYVFATHYWHHLEQDGDSNWTIRGKTDLDIRKDKENAIKAMAADMEILRTGKGTNYIIEERADGISEYLELIKRPVFDDDGNVTGIIALINDVTEQQLLKMSLEEKAMKDELTGAYNRYYFDSYISSLERNQKMPVAFISADCDNLKIVNDTYGHLVGDEYLHVSVLLFKTVMPEKCEIFRIGGDEFLIVLPGMTLEEAEEYIDKLEKESQQFSIKDRKVSISCGAACMTEPTQKVRDCINAADKKMYENKRRRKQGLQDENEF